MMLRLALATLVCGLILVAIGAESRAQNPFLPNMAGHDGISVYGTGELPARPNLVEIDLHVSGKAELTGDALVKFRDAKKRVLEALEKLKLAGLSTDELGLSITAGSAAEQQQRMNNGMPQVATKPQIEVSATLRVRLKDVRQQAPEELIKTIGKLLDVAQDSGVTIGPSPAEVMRNARFGNYMNNTVPVRFVVADLAQVREKAYEQAVADARSRAARLAKLNQVKLGQALSVQEIQVAGDHQQQGVNPNFPYVQFAQPVADDGGDDEPRITSASLSGIHVQVKLLVRFAIVAPEPATAQQ
jgi:uncharacterized protein YggE